MRSRTKLDSITINFLSLVGLTLAFYFNIVTQEYGEANFLLLLILVLRGD